MTCASVRSAERGIGDGHWRDNPTCWFLALSVPGFAAGEALRNADTAMPSDRHYLLFMIGGGFIPLSGCRGWLTPAVNLV
jgi:hypothetical protein